MYEKSLINELSALINHTLCKYSDDFYVLFDLLSKYNQLWDYSYI